MFAVHSVPGFFGFNEIKFYFRNSFMKDFGEPVGAGFMAVAVVGHHIGLIRRYRGLISINVTLWRVTKKSIP